MPQRSPAEIRTSIETTEGRTFSAIVETDPGSRVMPGSTSDSCVPSGSMTLPITPSCVALSIGISV